MSIETLQAIVDFSIQMSRFAIILTALYFIVSEYQHLRDGGKPHCTVRKILIGFGSAILGMMLYLFYGRIVSINPFALGPSLIWLGLHLFLLGVIIYSTIKVRHINRK